jgi:hypothetical protein
MPSVDMSQRWDYPALPVGPVAVERPHGVIGLGSAVSQPFNFTPPPAPPPVLSTPVIGNWTPNPTSQIAASTAVGFDVTDTHGLRTVIVYAATGNGAEVVYDEDAFVSPYAAGSSTTPITNGLRFRVVRDGGWVTSPRLTVVAVNTDGIEATGGAPPTVSNWTPAAGTQITATTPIGFDVTDVAGLAQVIVYAAAAGGTTEQAFNGTAFTANYGAASTRTAIAGGFRFRIVRDGGWTVAPQITVAAVNVNGIEA